MCYTHFMSKKLKKAVAITALVFVGIFTVSFVVFLFDRTLLNGAIGFLAMFSGGIGLALFLVVKLSRGVDEDKNTDDVGEADEADAALSDKNEKPDDDEK